MGLLDTLFPPGPAKIDGVASQVTYVSRPKGIGFLAAQAYAIKHGAGRSPQEEVMTFMLPRPKKLRGDYPYVSVEMCGSSIRDTVRDGDEVTVYGTLNRQNTFVAKWIQLSLTGRRIEAGK